MNLSDDIGHSLLIGCWILQTNHCMSLQQHPHQQLQCLTATAFDANTLCPCYSPLGLFFSWNASGILALTWRKSQVWLQHYWMTEDKMFLGPAHSLGELPKRQAQVRSAIPQSRCPPNDWESHPTSYCSGRTILYSRSPGGEKKITQSLRLTESASIVFSEKRRIWHSSAGNSYTFFHFPISA